MASVGEIIGGKYRLDRLLGEGGMGAVFAAENLNTGRRVAVKVLHGQWAERPEVAQRFVREARATTAIAHPNIVEVFDLDSDAARGITYIVQEFLEGETLEAHLASRPGSRLGAREALEIIVPVMEAIVAAHARGIVHRDIKPANIFLVRGRGGELVPKVIDFGIAKDLASAEGASNRTQEGLTIGTPSYMSPEQVSGSTDVDAQTDVWALGVVLYQMLSGRLPFESPQQNVVMAKILLELPTPIASHCPELPAGLIAIVDGALRRDRRERLGSVRAMMSAALECGEWPRNAQPRGSVPPEQALPSPTRPSLPPTAPVHATQPVQGMYLPLPTQPIQATQAQPWSASAPPSPGGGSSPSLPPTSVGPVPDTMHAVSRSVTQPAVSPKRSPWPFVLGGVLVLAVIGGLVASLSSPDQPVAAAPAPTSHVTVAPQVVRPAPARPVVAPPVAVQPAPVRPVTAQPAAVQPAPIAPVAAAPAPLAPLAPVDLTPPGARRPSRHAPRSDRRSRSSTGLPTPSFEPLRPAAQRPPQLNADEI